MGEAGDRLKELLAQYRDVPEGKNPEVAAFKKTMQDFLERGPGTREERRQLITELFVEGHKEYQDFLKKRN